MQVIKPQPGFQEKALATSADIAILGGAAGGGKTWIELYEPLRHIQNKFFRCVIFRRTTPQIKGPGGLWDSSNRMYPQFGGVGRETFNDWEFQSGAKILMRHIEHEKNLNDWQGTEIDLIEFDELTHFSQLMFTYFLSRGRSSTSGVRSYIRATCNPDPDSWVARFIEWWIDQETGFPIPERVGMIRYVTCINDTFIWGDTVEEVLEQAPSLLDNQTVKESGLEFEARDLIKSVTFIPGKLSENTILLKSNPGYLGSLLALPEKEKATLLLGNWKIRTDGSELFEYVGIDNLFSNFPERDIRPRRCITCDAARFGRDFMVIMVWRGWEVVHISVYKKSDVHDIKNEIERLRQKFNVPRTEVVVDQDGVGGDTVKFGQYTGFSGGIPALVDPETGIKEMYHNLKTQCYYRMSKRANEFQIRVNVSNETCYIVDESSITNAEGKPVGRYTTKIKIGVKIWDIQDLIKADLRAIKRAKIDEEKKFTINTKIEQKEILGRSPDFGDTFMMREYLELMGTEKTISQKY